MRYRPLSPVLAVALVCLLTACGSASGPKSGSTSDPSGQSAASSGPKRGGTLVMVHGEPEFWNPIREVGFQGATFLVYDGLVTFNEKRELAPALATNWDIAPDGLTYTFTLRQGVKWHDGNAFSSADVKFTYDSILDEAKNSPYRSQFAAVKQVDAPAPDKVVFHLSTPNASFLFRTIIGILPKHLWEKEDLSKSTLNQKPVGTGAWKLVDWHKGDQATFEANRDWYGGAPYLDKLVLKVIPDAAVALAALERGDVNYIPFTGLVGGLPYEQLKVLAKNPNVAMQDFSVSSLQLLFMRTDIAPWNNVKLRQAVAYAVNRQFIVDKVLFGYGTVLHSIVPPTFTWVYNNNVPQYDYNPAKAEQLLEEAGLKKGVDGIRLKTTIYATPGVRQTMSEIIKEQLKAVGIDVRIVTSEWGAYMDTIRVKRAHDGLWTILTYPKIPDPDDGTPYVSPDDIKPGGINPSFYANPRIGELITMGRQVTDQKERAKIYAEYQEIIARDLPVLPLYLAKGVDLWSKNYQGFYSSEFGPGSLGSLPKVWRDGK